MPTCFQTRRLLLATLVFLFAGCSSKPALRGANISTEASVEDLRHFAKDLGGKVVRVLDLDPMSSKSPYAVNEKAWNAMVRTTERALDEGLAVVFAPGVAMDDNDTFFKTQAFRDAYLHYWERVARYFQNDPRAIAFDLMNEPHDKLARTEWSGYAKTLTQAIRKIDSRHTIVVEAPEWDWPPGFSYLTPTGDSNTIYSFHSYAPNEFTLQKTSKGYPGSVMEGELWNRETMARKLEPVFEFARKYKVTIWCGEFGVARWAKGGLEWMRDMISIFEAHHIGWAYYSYREWQVMDLEMDAKVKNQKTQRTDTPFMDLLRSSYSK